MLNLGNVVRGRAVEGSITLRNPGARPVSARLLHHRKLSTAHLKTSEVNSDGVEGMPSGEAIEERSSSSVRFGTVACGEYKVVTMHLRNKGAVPCS